MSPNISDKLLSDVSQPITVIKVDKGRYDDHEGDHDHDRHECDCAYVTLSAVDAMFASFVVAPLVVGVWRGTWGLMNIHSNLFPYPQSYVLGILIHICFALIRSHLLSRARGAWSGPDGGAGRWTFERAFSRGYTIIFIMSCIMHWRGGWGLLDAAVEAVLPDPEDPHRPVIIAALLVLMYACAAFLRSSRNFLAPPYFLVTDGKEPTYIFTTRFRQQLIVSLFGLKPCNFSDSNAKKGAFLGLILSGSTSFRDNPARQGRRYSGYFWPGLTREGDGMMKVLNSRKAEITAGYDRVSLETLSGAVGMVADLPDIGNRARAAASLRTAALAADGAGPRLRTLAPDADMRGSTAGLPDTLAGGSRARAALLALADAVFASALVAPAVVTYWKSTWSLMDLYVWPTRPVASATACATAGLAFNLAACAAQTWLGRLHPDRGRLTYWVSSRLYTGLSSVACVGAWRGVWNLLNECTGEAARTVAATTVAAALSLAALRALRNVLSAPFAVALDSPHDYFQVPTMYRTSSRETALFILDCVFSVCVVGSLVVFVWRGSWALLDIFLYPEDQPKSCWASLIIGYTLVVLTFGLQVPLRWAAARLQGAPKLLLADLYHLLAFVATVNVWRGVWGLLDIYLFPDTPKLSNWLSHGVSLALLMLLNCSNSILVRGVYIDAEEPAGECVVFPCHYLRLYFHKQRTKKRHRQALAAAATVAARKPEDAALTPLQLPIVQEKV
ncbi:hypothetical protein EVAR_74_1 [Eumeta japonica]|uniref:Uncharacterized protein n=1 Tax=Eumeta variegata TaxID=151549 RepID=A0A4C1S7Y5_EUMVA|nr:hypothetical protein EVAR_74_1 [Eumeta japonica]